MQLCVNSMTEDFEKRLKAFYSDVVTTCGAQCDIIAKVFPQPLIVFKSLLDWLFEAQVSDPRESSLSMY